jgi:uncharacterized protein (TIGR02996 family)
VRPQEQALLRAVLDDPEDDGIRLIYADWLEEHGRAERAEFIRAQVEDARLPRAEAVRRRTLRDRQAALVADHAAAWTADMPSLVQDYVFRRGFVGQVRMSCPADALVFLEQFQALLALHPVSCLGLTSGVIDVNDVDGCYTELPLPTLRAFGAAPCASRLRALDISMEAVHDEGAFAVAAAPHFSNLERLNMYAVGVTDAGARALAESRHLTRLRGIDLFCNSISPAGSQLLRQRFGEGVRLEAEDPQVIVWPRHNAPLPWEREELD